MTEAILPFVVFAVTAGVIVVAGTFLSRFGDAIAELTGLGRLLIGSILVAGATSLPELTVDVSAVRLAAVAEEAAERANLLNIAVGDLMGSSLFNLLILGILDLTTYSRGHMLSRRAAAHSLAAIASVALTAIAAMSILLAPELKEFSLFNVGVGSILIVLTYGFCARLVFFDQRFVAQQTEATPGVTEPETKLTLKRALLGFFTAAAAIFAAAPFLAKSAEGIAEVTGIGGTFVGTTLVALSTSLPELVACLAALRIGAVDMAIGNVFGSNAFNMVLLVPLDLAYGEPLLAHVHPVHAATAMATVLASCVVIAGQLYHVERRKPIIEPDGLLVIGIVLTTFALVYHASSGVIDVPAV